jgi:hypothetical protein
MFFHPATTVRRQVHTKVSPEARLRKTPIAIGGKERKGHPEKILNKHSLYHETRVRGGEQLCVLFCTPLEGLETSLPFAVITTICMVF